MILGVQGIVRNGTEVGKIARAVNTLRLTLEGAEVEEVKRSGPGGSYLLATFPDGHTTLYAPSNRKIGPKEDISVHINDEPWTSVKEMAHEMGTDSAGVIFNFAVDHKNRHQPARAFDGITSAFMTEETMMALAENGSGVVTRTPKAWRLIVTPTWRGWEHAIVSGGGMVDYWLWRKGSFSPSSRSY